MRNPLEIKNSNLYELANRAEKKLAPVFAALDETVCRNQQKVLSAFINNNISDSHFSATTGYGYNDRGRDALDRVVADTFGAQDALIRHNFVCGTHALTVALFGVLRPGDTMLSVTGTPYDTIQSVIGITDSPKSGSLKEFGINYREIQLSNDGSVNIAAIPDALTEDVKMVYIQRSRGYTLRPSLTVAVIEEIAAAAKRRNPDVIVMVDNCYGEFVETDEPTQHGADLMAGSLIKNPGGGIAPTGGYIAGRSDLVEKCSYRLTTPGTGREVGCTMGHNRELFMGFFNAPHVTGEALKSAMFCSALFEEMGYEVSPKFDEPRTDIIQSVIMKTPEALSAFCRGIQSGAPIDSSAVPVPDDMPGYDSKVIMAAGAFTMGASIELSADAPLREPYAVWMQGGLNYHSAKAGILLAADCVSVIPAE
ncbi:MAG: methionine gamma-lyase family protein [Oscillospiraceae bacterium]|jgi:cystathionine beta-lyase family protein involved in aluminum resistance|nr:methionine gamma-lyase family protein [Oscillospiraceae bacterium]